MDLLEYMLPSQSGLHLEGWDLDQTNEHMTLSVTSMQAVACCPVCSQTTHRVHSRYERTLEDLPLVQFGLTIILQVCKFFCLNEQCHRRIFTERLPEVAAPWARRTVRLAKHLSAIGLALGGAAASRLSHQLGYSKSRNTMLRLIGKLPLPEMVVPKVLGVDDFAFRKGQTYGTILVDLDTHRPIALLPDRQAQTLANWLKKHPGVEILARDRSTTYKSGMTQGAPDAIQVADRFHLLQNLEEVLEKVFKALSNALTAIEVSEVQQQMAQVQIIDVVAVPVLPVKPDPQSIKELNRARRLEKYEQTHKLRQEGHLIKDIAHHLGIGKRTVYKYLAAPTFPERQPSQRLKGSGLDGYKPYLLQQWNQGHQNTKQLFAEIQKYGYQGSYATVARYTHQLRQSQPRVRPERDSLNDLPGRGPVPPNGIIIQEPLTAVTAAWLVMRKEQNLTDDEKQRLKRLEEHPELTEAIALAQDFLFLVRKRLPQLLDAWLERAKSTSLKAFQSFANGLQEDYDAVKAGVTLEVSSGPVEGNNNRLKMLKRQMYGRAGLDLLNRRLVLGN